MPTIKLYHHGMTAGMVPKNNSHERAKRGVVQGWSPSAARNNTRWLRSIHPKSLTGAGYAFTLTLRTCPETSDDWATLVDKFIKRLRRLGLLRLHWVTEWQRRGVPHLHGIAYFPEDRDYSQLICDKWLALASPLGAMPVAQHVTTVTDIAGWFKYLSKHAARGAQHYQRSSENIPEGWVKTGRVWGHSGDWKVTEPGQYSIDNQGFWAFRRIVRSWRKADARADFHTHSRVKDPLQGKRRIVHARNMLKNGNRKVSSRNGVSEWIPSAIGIQITEHLLSQGHQIVFEEEP